MIFFFFSSSVPFGLAVRNVGLKEKTYFIIVRRIEVIFSNGTSCKRVRFTKHMKGDQDILPCFSFKNPLDTTVFSGTLKTDS